jgi:hypothetical protein
MSDIVYIDGIAQKYNNFFECLGKNIHCETGPAVILEDGRQFFFLDGKQLSELEYTYAVFKKDNNLDTEYPSWSVDMQVLFKLTNLGALF